MRKIVLYCAIPTVFLLAATGLIYYSESGLNAMETLFCTLENTVLAFVARPSLTSFNVFRAIDEDYSELEKLITHLYGIVVILAPILTTTAVMAGFQTYLLDLWYAVKPTGKKKLIIIGDGTAAKRIALRYADEYYCVYLMPSKTEKEVRLPVLKKGVCALPTDYDSILEPLKKGKAERAAGVVLNFRDWFDHYKTVTDSLEYLIENSQDREFPVTFVDAPVLFRDTVLSVSAGFCKKYGKPEKVLKIMFPNLTALNAQAFFEHPVLTRQPGKRHHIAFLGIGEYGSAMLVELIRAMIRDCCTGTLEIFDRCIDRKINDLAYGTNYHASGDMYEVVEEAEHAKYSAIIRTEAGPIRENFYQGSVGDWQFDLLIREIAEKENYTEMFFCIDDLSVNFECYRLLKNLIPEDANVRLFFRAGQELKTSFEAIELENGKIFRLPDSLPSEEILRKYQTSLSTRSRSNVDSKGRKHK